jgi:hypothetical protein
MIMHTHWKRFLSFKIVWDAHHEGHTCMEADVMMDGYHK